MSLRCVRKADEAVVAVPDIQDGVGVEGVDFIQPRLLGDKPKPVANVICPCVVVVGAVAIVPAIPPEEPIFFGEVVIDLDGEIVVLSRLLSQSRIKDISIDQKSGRRPSLGRTKEREKCFGHRADPIGRNNVVRELCAISNRSRSRVESASQRIIDFDFG